MPDILKSQITAANFTESDKRSVMSKFIRNKEIMFLIFGLMFPYKTLMATKTEAEQKTADIGLEKIPEEI